MHPPVADRLALEDLMVAYCYAVDALDDLDALLALFTADAELDFSAIGLPVLRGRAEMRRFYQGVFADMRHHTHCLSNFQIEQYRPERAVTRAYVHGLGIDRRGTAVEVHVRYRMECLLTAAGWRIARYWITPGMPLPGDLAAVHGDRY